MDVCESEASLVYKVQDSQWLGRRRIWGERTEKEFEMTDQEFEKGLAELMAEDGTGKKKGKK